MNQINKKKFAEVITGMSTIYSQKLTPEGFEIYFNAMRDWSIEEFVSAANELVKTCQFMPRPFDFEQLRRDASPSNKTSAWLSVLENVKASQYRIGRTVGGTVDRAVQAVGGYNAIGMCSNENLQWLEKRFYEAYENLHSMQDAHKALGQTQETRNAVIPNFATTPVAVNISTLAMSKRV